MSWKTVVGLLVLLPFLFALVLSQWLGTPRERVEEQEVFSLLRVAPVRTVSNHSLVYGQILFSRIELTGGERTEFLRALSDFEVSRGVAERPISLKLERMWWSPPGGEEGTYWKREEATIWSPDRYPETFFVVVLLEEKATQSHLDSEAHFGPDP